VIPELGLRQDEPWKRIVAKLIDGFILGIPYLILNAAFFGINDVECTSSSGSYFGIDCGYSYSSYLIRAIVMILITAGYYIGTTVALQATIGKLAMGLKVVKQDGSKVDPITAATRHAIDVVPALLLILPFFSAYLLGSAVLLIAEIYSIVLVFQDPRQASVWDKIGKTYVVCK